MNCIKVKILFPTVIMFIFFTSVMVTQVFSIKNSLQQIKDINEQAFTTLLKAERLKLNVVQVQQWLTDISATRAAEGLDDGFDEAEKNAKGARVLISELNQINLGKEQELAKITEHFDAYYESGKKMAQAYIDGGPTEGNKMMGDFDSTAIAINASVDVFVSKADEQVQIAISSIEKSIQKTIILLVISIIVSFLLCLNAWIFTTKRVVKPILLLLEKLEDLSNKGGDLTQQITINSNDQIGLLAKATNKFIGNVRDIIGNVMESADQATISSRQLAVSAEETEHTANQIESTINGVANSAMKQAEYAKNMLQMMEKAVTNVLNGRVQTTKTLANAKKSTQFAHDGEQAINEAIIHLQTITETVNYAMDSVQKLGKRSEEIGGIITAISNIADQTNLLALNAAIEAARAGDAGKGFAVVANEVRKLAEQSSQSSGQIAELINHIQGETLNTIHLMENNVLVVEEQVRIIAKGGDSLKNIVESVEETELQTQNINEIFNAFNKESESVLNAIQEISTLIENSSSLTEEVAAASEEQCKTAVKIANSSLELASMAEQLQKQVNRFSV